MIRRPPALDHLVALTDDVGIVQHANHDVPNRSTGYCTDDVARAFMVSLAACEHESLADEGVRLARIYLSFLHDAQLPDGRFHNFMSYARTWLDEAGTEDSFGRALWALGAGMRFAPRRGWQKLCGDMLEAALPHVEALEHLRARAYAALGLAHAAESGEGARGEFVRLLGVLGEDFRARYRTGASEGWDWFESFMTYDNARLCEAAMRIGMVLNDSALMDLGVRTLRFYEGVTLEEQTFVPVGNEGWYERGGRRARYGQQPLEAAAMIDAAFLARDITGDAHFRRLAQIAFEWYFGRNSIGVALAVGGGCCDGLEVTGVNHNMGAESTLAYLSSALAFAQPVTERLRIAR